jgi:hypothetical protein
MKLEIPLYDIKIKFYFDYDLGKHINKIKKKHNKKKLYKISKIDFDGIVIGEFIPKNELIYVLIKKTGKGINVDTLTHEIYHLTNKIMKYNGFKFNKTDEPFAILNGKLNSMIMGELIKREVKVYYPIETKQIKIKK